MLIARDARAGTRVEAREAIKGHDYACRFCGAKVIVKQGTLRVAHYAHMATCGCVYAGRESMLHIEAKYNLYDALRASDRAERVELERPMRDVRPDVYAVIGGSEVAIEVQASVLGVDKIATRTSAYERLGVHVVWLDLDMNRVRAFLKDQPRPGHIQQDTETGCNRWVRPYEPRYAPRAWERWLHELYYGNVFFYEPGAGTRLTRVRFGPATISRDGGYDHTGAFHDGYDYTSKRWRTPKVIGHVDLLDLHPKERDAWRATTPSLPKARIMMAIPQARG